MGKFLCVNDHSPGAWLPAVMLALVFILLCACSASRKSVAECAVSVDSLSSEVAVSGDVGVAVTAHSRSSVSVKADSAKVFPVSVVQPDDAPVPSPRVLPAYAASLYGLHLDFADADSSSLLISSSSTMDASLTAVSADAASKEVVSAQSQSQSPKALWMFVVLFALMLAIVVALRFIVKSYGAGHN